MNKRIVFIVIIILTIFAVFGFSYKSYISSGQNQKEKSTDDQQKIECEETGGVWEQIGYDDQKRCIYQYDDAGTDCKSSEECEGKCIRYQPEEAFECQKENFLIGCFSIIEECYNGECPILCVD